MVKPTLIYLMLVLTVFQSSIAMGDVDQITQSGSDNFSINNIDLIKKKGYDIQKNTEIFQDFYLKQTF